MSEDGEYYEKMIDTKASIQDQIRMIRKILGHNIEWRFQQIEKEMRFQSELITALMDENKNLKRAIEQLQTT